MFNLFDSSIMYNGMYESVTELIVQHEDHDECRRIALLAKKLCDAWGYSGVRYDEHKSARKGPVLSRDLLIYQIAYAHDTIIFKESLLCAFRTFIYNGTIRFKDRGTTPIDNQIE